MVERVIFLDKNLEISLLFDFYGSMLSDTQQQAVSLYYNDDLSLKETSDILSMSRQGVRDALSRAKKSLYTYEENLQLCERFSKTREGLEQIIASSQQLVKISQDDTAKKLSQRIHDIANKLYEQEV